MTKQDFSSSDFEILDQTTEYQGHLKVSTLRIRHKLFAGGWSSEIRRECVERGEAVSVVLYDPNQDAVVLVEQFRVGAYQSDNPWMLECVAGVVEPGEDDVTVAQRETEEEAGLIIQDPCLIYEYYTTAGICSEKVSLFYAECDSSQAKPMAGLEEENEDIRVHVVALSQAMDWVRQGRITNVNTLLGLQWLDQKLNHNRVQR